MRSVSSVYSSHCLAMNSMSERFKTIDAVFAAVIKDRKVLLLLRQNTGWLDGYWDMPSGHLEEGETILAATVRELYEETGLVAESNNLRLSHVYQNYHNEDRPYMGFIFETLDWKGTPKISEPEKCGDMRFFDLESLPKTAPYIKEALDQLASKNVTFSYHGPGSMEID